ncbi:MAG: phage tail family protein [Tetragenococcus koreensis]|nr:phage tail family protein [Tetragenococcus koreensis]
MEVNENTTEINGTDGVLLGPATFGPFNLVLNFSFKGVDIKDLKLIKQKLRGLLFRREPFFVWHSDAPGKKYAVYCDSNENEDLTNSFATFAVTFVVYKGYSESLKMTDEFNLLSEEWQFEQGLEIDDSIEYTHHATNFKIFNGSTDTIDPLLRHQLQIKINMDAPNGFKLTNKTTGDVFEYKESIKSSQQLVLNGVHPFLGSKRVGINTNWQWITLKNGFNNVEVTGKDIKNVTTQWIFPFIYR